MALQLSKEGGITLSFPPVNLPSLYVRIGFTAVPSGTIVAVQALPFYNKEHFQSKTKALDIALPKNNPAGLFLQVEQQNVMDVHLAAKEFFEGQGYIVDIIDID